MTQLGGAQGTFLPVKLVAWVQFQLDLLIEFHLATTWSSS